jgi:hypothetical protein
VVGDIRANSVSNEILVLLFRDVIRKFGLEEVCFSVISVPLNKVAKSMFGHEAISSDEFTIDNKPCLHRVFPSRDWSSSISTDVVISSP